MNCCFDLGFLKGDILSRDTELLFKIYKYCSDSIEIVILFKAVLHTALIIIVLENFKRYLHYSVLRKALRNINLCFCKILYNSQNIKMKE